MRLATRLSPVSPARLRSLSVMSVDVGGDSVMDAPTQPIPVDDAEGEDEESPLTHASRTAERAPPVLGQLHNEDLQARNEALRDAAIAAEALKAATSAAEVIPLAEPNPYALAAAHVSSTAAASTAPGLALPVNSRRQRERLESPEKKPKVDRKKAEPGSRQAGLEAPPLFGGGGLGRTDLPSHASPVPPPEGTGRPPQVFHLDPPPTNIPSWVGDLRDMLTGGQREIMFELHTHKAHLSTVSHQVQNLDKRQEDLTRAQGDMVARLNNMEAEVRDLKTRSRSVSPAPPVPDQSPRSTTASTLGGRPAIDDFQIVIGGWNDAKRGDIEAEIRNLFELNQASPLLHNIHVPFVRSKFARVELLYTGGNLTERRKVQSLVIEALKKTFRDFKSNISGQESRTLWVTRNRSKEDREKIRALVSIKDWAFKHTSAILIDLDWRGKLWIRGEQVLYWHQFRRPDEGAMMLTNAAGDETGWWVDVRQLSRILAIPVDQVRDELLD